MTIHTIKGALLLRLIDNSKMNQKLISYLRKPRLFKRLWNKFLSLFYLEQWIIFISTTADHTAPDWKDFKPVVPPPDRDWADPFIWTHSGRNYIFIEEKPYSTDRGHIACLALDDEMNVVSNTVVLQRPYHLSYPFLFTYDNQLYMLPETKANSAVELYRCVQFPNHWEFEKTLIPNVKAVDSTLFERHGKWWLFVNIEEKGGNSWDTLCLYSADSPLSDHWAPFSNNPIVKDIKTARPAGKILLKADSFIRPSQDCSVRYGYAINFNRIIRFTETDYAETQEQKFQPSMDGNILGTHTWNESNNVVVIDAMLRRNKLQMEHK